MSALTILIVVVAAVPYSLELQLDSYLNDIINWLNHPERLTQEKNKIKINQKEQEVNNHKYLQAVNQKTSKIFEHIAENSLKYLDTVANQPLNIYNDDREANNKEVLNQYLSVKPPWLKSLPMKRKPNYQLDRGHGGNNLYEDGRHNDLTDYSKIYLVLNPEAKLEKSDIKDISNLVSSMLSKNDINHNNILEDYPERLYKRFVRRDIRRRIRESNEAYAPKDSMEYEHKPKRVRVEFSGSRGRTGIPYVHHRGAVYEKD